MTIPAVPLAEEERDVCEPVRALTFQCKCGCESFRVEVEIYADHSWATVISCVACASIVTPTEPMTNGPH